MQWDGAPAVAAFSHGMALLAFVVLACLLLRRTWRQRPHARAMAWTAAATALWAASCMAVVVADAWPPPDGVVIAAPVLVEAAEALRTACWLALLLALSGAAPRLLVCAPLLPAAALTVSMQADASPLLRAGLPLASSVLGMLLVEHLYRSAPLNKRWGIKFACLGMGALFAFDFYLYSDAMLLRRVNPDIWAARGMVNAMSAPLLATAMARGPAWTPGLQLSRQIMFHSAALLGAAMYLLAMAASAWYLRYVGGAWGALMQLACLCGAALLLTAVLFSGAMRARLKLFISKHFYQGRYDYREEWQRFTRALADDAGGLPERAIQAVAALVESPAGMLWLRGADGAYQPATRWNLPLPAATEGADGPLCHLLSARGWVIELPEWRAQPARYDGHVPPLWAAQLWLIVPLMLDRSLFGFICLAPPRTALQLNWEVRDVLKIAGSQAASYLAHRASAESLAVARQFESFNRMSTFIVHDLKNLVSQLSLLLVNAEKHKANPAFQDDMLDTLSHSLGKMKHLLLKLRRDDAPDAAAPLQLDELLARAVQAHVGSEPRPSLELRAAGLTVLANGQRLERVIGHLIQNAVEATPRSGHVAVRMQESGDSAVIELSDTGHGMSEQFVREHLFQPFVSTKTAGMGIGVFESREYLRELGGQLQVTSAPSQGTTFRVTLPLHKEFDHGKK
ncbi:PEP-CTERM system histidine kinase PrsK [Pseudoduganella sp. FT25W]|uniref:histidine kinase n=1 Tax=Duganella alba TaxID=2666081 RepID=A0A6L5Q9T6_9BURK|nr:XrtA/PEP-CTERM system histidine kinase PrsK [Duganella alba]MRX06426.1 PEP-CTERM system histidine kinase PrsK [Duganella alba]MRX14820.1 PEP-CTERM system histidine kinase PrsK [Duganella alba]